MTQSIIKNGKIQLRPYSPNQLATVYNVCTRTFMKWLQPFHDEIGQRHGRYFTITQVKAILKKLGLPSEISIDE